MNISKQTLGLIFNYNYVFKSKPVLNNVNFPPQKNLRKYTDLNLLSENLLDMLEKCV